jgi:hypothetical protein
LIVAQPRPTPQHIELMPKGENFGLQGCARPEQPGHGVPDQLEKIAHRRDYPPIRIDSCLGFAVGRRDGGGRDQREIFGYHSASKLYGAGPRGADRRGPANLSGLPQD